MRVGRSRRFTLLECSEKRFQTFNGCNSYFGSPSITFPALAEPWRAKRRQFLLRYRRTSPKTPNENFIVPQLRIKSVFSCSCRNKTYANCVLCLELFHTKHISHFLLECHMFQNTETRRNIRQFVQLIFAIVHRQNVSDKPGWRTLDGWRLLEGELSVYVTWVGAPLMHKTLFLQNNLLKNLHNRETLHVFFWVNNIVVVVALSPFCARAYWIGWGEGKAK